MGLPVAGKTSVKRETNYVTISRSRPSCTSYTNPRIVRSDLHPVVRLELADLLAHVLLHVLKGMEVNGRVGPCACLRLDGGVQLFFAGLHQAAVGVIDDHELFRAQQVMGHQDRAKCIIGHDAARIPDHVHVARLEPESPVRNARVHAGQDGKFQPRTRRNLLGIVVDGEFSIGGEGLINCAHRFCYKDNKSAQNS